VSAASKRAAELAARAAAVNAGSTASAEEHHQDETPLRFAVAQVRKSALAESTPASASAPRTRPVRVTVELSPIEHRQLRRLCERYADELGITQVAGAEVLRALLAMATTDEQVAARLGKALRRSGGSRRR